MKTNHILKAVILFACLATAISCTDDFKPVAPPSGSTITEIASGSNDFNILTAALTRTGLASTFANNNAGVFTVFAPTDAAFVAYFNAINIPTAGADEAAILTWINSTLSTTTSPSLSTLTSVLLYHVIISEVKSDKVTGAQGFVTLNGTTRISISKVGANVVLNANRAVQNSAGNGAQSVTLDIDASNGVIHSIDRVLIPVSNANIWIASLLNFGVNYGVSPPAVTVYGTTLRRVPPVAPSTTPGPINLTDAAALAPVDAVGTNYNLLSMAIARAELSTVIIPIAQPFPDFTVFAPTDAAFLTYLGVADEAAARTAINNLSPAALADLVRYHVVPGRVLSTDLSNGQTVNTALAGKAFTILSAGNPVTINDLNSNVSAPTADATVTSVNNLTNAGVLHQISAVLRPN